MHTRVQDPCCPKSCMLLTLLAPPGCLALVHCLACRPVLASPHPSSRRYTQVKAGSIFDNILVCDDPEFAKTEAEKNILPLMTKEKEMKKKADDEEAEKRRKEEEERKAKEAVNTDDDDDDDDDDEDEDDKKKKEL